MNDLRTAAQQALEAMRCGVPTGKITLADWSKALSDLDAALTQGQEPVWIQPDHLQKARVAPFLCRVEPTQRFPDFVALYTAQPKPEPVQKPLTISKLRAALVGARIVDPDAVEDPDGYDDGVTLRRIESLHRRLT